MKLYSWNLNGFRAAVKNGLLDWIHGCEGDLIMFQEVRALEAQLQVEWLKHADYYSYWAPAEKKGYSGVAIYSKEEIPLSHRIYGLGIPEFDSEGRTLGVIIKDTAYFSCYFPNTQAFGARLAFKLAYCEALLKKAKELEKQGLKVVLAGDFNIAHTPLDLENPKQNEKNPGYLPEEREWFSKFLAEGYIDTFRQFEKRKGFYTWWSNRPGVRERNVGWRIDYHCISESLVPNLKSATIHAHVLGSDHCPVELVLD